MERAPVVAGRFYPGSPLQLNYEIENYLNANISSGEVKKPWAVMLPHAGYMFCGDIIGKTLANIALPQNLVILCPNHTGMGLPLGVWAEGSWQTPLGAVPVNKKLAAELINTHTGFHADPLSHLREHSIEVLLPFLQKKVPSLSIVPVCVGVHNAAILENAAKGLAMTIKSMPGDIGIVVSSDMNHYENEKTTFAKDQLALNAILANDPDGLLETVAKNNISMCGAAPMALALYTAKILGNIRAQLIAHDSSARASGDHEHTVGYAGMDLFLEYY